MNQNLNITPEHLEIWCMKISAILNLLKKDIIKQQYEENETKPNVFYFVVFNLDFVDIDLAFTFAYTISKDNIMTEEKIEKISTEFIEFVRKYSKSFADVLNNKIKK